jgi:hypothetical protein
MPPSPAARVLIVLVSASDKPVKAFTVPASTQPGDLLAKLSAEAGIPAEELSVFIRDDEDLRTWLFFATSDPDFVNQVFISKKIKVIRRPVGAAGV